ncbi:MAG: hypothetical protein AAFN74_23215 [Myxococcota bacterium]
MATVLIAAAGGCWSGCGYTSLGERTRSLYIPKLSVADASIDTMMVERAVILAARGHAAFRSVDANAPALVAKVHVESAETGLAPLAEPAVRAAHYRSVVELRAEVFDQRGQAVWQGRAIGRADMISPSGALETLDGATRRTMRQAADRAAQSLLDRMALDIVWR